MAKVLENILVLIMPPEEIVMCKTKFAEHQILDGTSVDSGI